MRFEGQGDTWSKLDMGFNPGVLSTWCASGDVRVTLLIHYFGQD